MTDLPEDINHWPNDPFRLLGIDRSTDARSARRAYFKLIKKFKPDKFPAEFQKVREAYESVEQWLSWQSTSDEIDDTNETESGASTNSPPPDRITGKANRVDPRTLANRLDPLPDEPVGPNSSNRSTHDPGDAGKSKSDFSPSEFANVNLNRNPFEQFHNLLDSGDVATAIKAINEIEPSSGLNSVARGNLTKYFLSRFIPGLIGKSNSAQQVEPAVSQGELKRISWLLSSLKHRSLIYPAIDRLRIEFDNNDRLANCGPFVKCLDRCENYEVLSELYRLRWQVLGCSDWRVVLDDFESLKPRLMEFGDGWEQLIADSMEYTVWHEADRCRKHNHECWNEISQSQNAWTADSVELLVLAAEQWKQVRGYPFLTDAIPWARNPLPNTVRRIWMPVAHSLAQDRFNSMVMLDQLYRKYSIAMSVFEEGLVAVAAQEGSNSEHEDWDMTRETVACFFADSSFKNYTSARYAILDFCVCNQVNPIQFAHVANSFPGSNVNVSWSDIIDKDGPLNCVYNACQAITY